MIEKLIQFEQTADKRCEEAEERGGGSRKRLVAAVWQHLGWWGGASPDAGCYLRGGGFIAEAAVKRINLKSLIQLSLRVILMPAVLTFSLFVWLWTLNGIGLVYIFNYIRYFNKDFSYLIVWSSLQHNPPKHISKNILKDIYIIIVIFQVDWIKVYVSFFWCSLLCLCDCVNFIGSNFLHGKWELLNSKSEHIFQFLQFLHTGFDLQFISCYYLYYSYTYWFIHFRPCSLYTGLFLEWAAFTCWAVRGSSGTGEERRATPAPDPQREVSESISTTVQQDGRICINQKLPKQKGSTKQHTCSENIHKW